MCIVISIILNHNGDHYMDLVSESILLIAELAPIVKHIYMDTSYACDAGMIEDIFDSVNERTPVKMMLWVNIDCVKVILQVVKYLTKLKQRGSFAIY